MKNIITAIAISTVAAFSNPWELTVDASLTGGLNTYNDAWIGEEVGNIFWKSTLFSEANRQFTEIFRIENNLNLEFGQTFDQITSENGDKSFSDPRVSSDLIDFNNRELLTLKYLAPYFGFRAQSNFMDQRPDNDSVKYLNPVILTESFGVSKKLLTKQENQTLEFRLAAAMNQNINRKIETISDGGIEFVTEYSVENSHGYLGYKTYLNLFKALVVSDSASRDLKIESVDVDWKNDAFVNVNRFIVITYSLRMLFNRYVSEDLRIKNSLSAGFNIIKTNKNDVQ